MAGIEQVLNYVKQINERLNQWAANAKKTEELPVIETMDPLGLLIVSELVGGVWTSKQLEIQKIIEGISLSGQDNKVREVLLGTITTDHDINYLLDNTGITVAENEIIVVTALVTINGTLVQKQFLWKLGKGEYNPIGSSYVSTKLIELQSRYVNDTTADELTSSPSAIVFDFGTISDSILTTINNAIPARNYTDEERIYYIRAAKDGENLLYNFTGVNGTYGFGESQMTESDLVLVYSSANTGNLLLEARAPNNIFKFIQKGVGNVDLENDEIGDIFCGWSNDGTVRIPEAIWKGGSLSNSDNFTPLVQIEIN